MVLDVFCSDGDRIRLQVAIGILVLTFGYGYFLLQNPSELISGNMAIFLILPVFLTLYIAMIALTFIPNKKLDNFRDSFMTIGNFLYSVGVFSAFYGILIYTLLYMINISVFNKILSTEIFGYTLFGVPWFIGVIAFVGWFLWPKKK
jgi:hypothetical protein